MFYIEVRDSRTGYLVPGRDGPGALPNGESSWETAAAAAAVAAVTWKMTKYKDMYTFTKWVCFKIPEIVIFQK